MRHNYFYSINDYPNTALIFPLVMRAMMVMRKRLIARSITTPRIPPQNRVPVYTEIDYSIPREITVPSSLIRKRLDSNRSTWYLYLALFFFFFFFLFFFTFFICKLNPVYDARSTVIRTIFPIVVASLSVNETGSLSSAPSFDGPPSFDAVPEYGRLTVL